MTGFANAAGLSVVLVVKEIASGVNDTRLKLSALLKDNSWGAGVVEHKDRLSGSVLAGSVLAGSVLAGVAGAQEVAVVSATEDKVGLMEDFVSIIYSFAARLYGLRSARLRTDDVIATLDPALGLRG